MKAETFFSMKTEAVVIDDFIGKRDVFRNWAFDYRRMENYLSPEQDFLGNNRNMNERGIWLRWILPSNLREEQADGKLPVIPNRYLITRIAESSGEIVSRVLEVDCPLADCMDDEEYSRVLPYTTIYLTGEEIRQSYLNSKDKYRSTAYFQRASELGGYYVNYGVDFPAENWEERDDTLPHLTACAPGNPDFSGYVRFHSNMLAFFDPLGGQPADKFHYSVIGWYSGGEKMNEFYSGQIFSIPWKEEGFATHGEEDPYGDELHKIQRTQAINVVLGRNADEAFRTWLNRGFLKQKEMSAEEEKCLEWMLAAFLREKTGIFEEEDGGWNLRESLHQAGFEAVYGGNRQTEEFDREASILHSMQEELQDVWWKYGYLRDLRGTDDAIAHRYGEELNTDKQNSLLNRTIQQYEKVRDLYPEYKNKIKEDKIRPQGRFWKPANPYLLISGLEEPGDMTRTNVSARNEDELFLRETQLPDTKGELPHGVKLLFREALSILRHIYLQKKDKTSVEKLPDYPVEPWHQPWKPAFIEWRLCYEDMDNFKFQGFEYRADELGKEHPERQEGFGGRVALDGHKKQQFIKQLDKLRERTGSEKLREKIEAVKDWKLLGQELVNVTEQMTQRDYRAFRRPNGALIQGTDYTLDEIMGYTSEDPEFLEAIGGGLDSIPYVRANRIPQYHHLQKGKIYLKDLILYDAFGRVLNLVSSGEGQGIHSAENFPLIVPEQLRGTVQEQSNGFLMKPALLQASRIHEEHCIYGFLVVNYLTHGLLVFTADGKAFGELILIDTGKAKRESCFFAKSGEAEYALQREQFPELTKYVDAMTGRKEDEFSQFIDDLEASFWTMRAAGGRKEERRALVAGRPLAFGKLAFFIEQRGLARKDKSWEGGGEKKYETMKFPMKLGCREKRSDGLAGFFRDDRFSDFFSITGEEVYLEAGCRKELAASSYVLFDPLLAIHIYSGILPVKQIWQNEKVILDIYSKMELNFRVGPIHRIAADDEMVTVQEGYLFCRQTDGESETREWFRREEIRNE